MADSAQERKLPATPRRREQARKRGQVPRSPELTAAAVLMAGVVGVRLLLPDVWERLGIYMSGLWGRVPVGDWDLNTVAGVLSSAVWTFLPVLGIFFGLSVLAAVAASASQVGLVFTGTGLVPNFGRVNPVAGLGRLFSLRGLVQLLKSLLKLFLLAWLMWSALSPAVPAFEGLGGADLNLALGRVGQAAWAMGIRAIVGFVAVAVIDYVYERWDYEKNLRMTPQEMQEEFKETEGSPQVRGRIRQRQRHMAMQRMMAAVPRAKVVVTNPDHYAVALRYEAPQDDAPVVVAKGQGYMALRIKEVARQHGVTIVENPPLARALFRTVAVGQAIPVELYQAVAEVLAFVYRLKGWGGVNVA